MGLKLGRDIVLAIDPTYKIDEMHIVDIANQSPKVCITFIAKNEEDKVVDVKKIELQGEQWIDFWHNWEGPFSLRKVYSLISETPVEEMPENIELEIIPNTVTEIVEQEIINGEE